MFFWGSSPTMRKSYFEVHVVDRVLHEDEVPDLDVPVVVGGRAAVDAVRGTAVEEDLRARPGRSRQSGAPVVRVLVEALDALLGQPGDPPPQVERLVVVLVDGDPEVLRVEPESAVGLRGRQQLPRVGDRALFEVVAERPVAEHLEERAVAGRLADLFDVVRADALLHVGGALVRRRDVAAQVRDERHHAGDREQQRRVVGDQGRRRHDGVVVLLEIAQEALGELGGLHGSPRKRAVSVRGHRLTGGSVGELLGGGLRRVDGRGRRVGGGVDRVGCRLLGGIDRVADRCPWPSRPVPTCVLPARGTRRRCGR